MRSALKVTIGEAGREFKAAEDVARKLTLNRDRGAFHSGEDSWAVIYIRRA